MKWWNLNGGSGLGMVLPQVSHRWPAVLPDLHLERCRNIIHTLMWYEITGRAEWDKWCESLIGGSLGILDVSPKNCCKTLKWKKGREAATFVFDCFCFPSCNPKTCSLIGLKHRDKTFDTPKSLPQSYIKVSLPSLCGFPAAECDQVIVKYCFSLFIFAQLFMQSTNITALWESEPNVDGHNARGWFV